MAFNPKKSSKSSRSAAEKRQKSPIRGAKIPTESAAPTGPKLSVKIKSSPARVSFSEASGSGPGAKPARAQLGLQGVRFPAAWVFAMDELVTTFVKANYSPRATWKDKPFSKDDAKFFFKGIEELSEMFTDERPRQIPAYFQHPRFRSAYLLYFLPLQAAKFITLFGLHPAAMDAAIEHGREAGAIRIVDLGAGPGTASIAAILALLDRATQGGLDLPPIELTWVDTSRAILEDGRKLVESLCNQFPKLRGADGKPKVQFDLIVEPWWKSLHRLPKEASLILMGNVLNEAAASDEAVAPASLWSEVIARAGGGGLLFLEPAAKKSSQLLSHLRDRFFENELLRPDSQSIWGPCLHAEKCPLAEGRDWCHFSVPVQIPGRWFKEFSEALSTERLWAKFSYLWLASPTRLAPPVIDRNLRRVVSDPLKDMREGGMEVLLCEPEVPFRMKLLPGRRIQRGDLIRKFKSAADNERDED